MTAGYGTAEAVPLQSVRSLMNNPGSAPHSLRTNEPFTLCGAILVRQPEGWLYSGLRQL